jgi:hypothetical protein
MNVASFKIFPLKWLVLNDVEKGKWAQRIEISRTGLLPSQSTLA